MLGRVDDWQTTFGLEMALEIVLCATVPCNRKKAQLSAITALIPLQNKRESDAESKSFLDLDRWRRRTIKKAPEK
jgi:hypothetical protein